MDDTIEKRKVIFLGGEGVGKTSLIIRFCKDKYTGKEPQTIGVQYIEKEITTNKHKVVLQLYDTAGQEKFRSFVPIFFKRSHVAFICFDFDDEKSLDVGYYINKLYEENPYCVQFLVATKFDKYAEKQIEISEFMTNVAQEFKSIKGVFYTSALSGSGIENVFKTAADVEVYQYNTPTEFNKLQNENDNTEKKGCCH